MKRALLAFSLLIPASVTACQNPGNDLCDPGQILDPASGYCIAAPADAAADARGDAGLADANDAGCTGGDAAAFGATCTVSSDCACPADYCAVMPGSPGFCTRTGCDADPSICPAKWTCLDLSAFQAGLPHICYE